MSQRSADPPFEILLIEDNPGDVRLFREALRMASIATRLHVVRSADDAEAWLRQATGGGAAGPDLIILDLNLPGRDGREFLEEIKRDQVLMRIPVVIFTSSDAGPDVLRCYRAHANSYVVKPGDLREFFRVVQSMTDFWGALGKIRAR